MRSSELDEATQTRALSSAIASRMPSTPLSSRSKSARISRASSRWKSGGSGAPSVALGDALHRLRADAEEAIARFVVGSAPGRGAPSAWRVRASAIGLAVDQHAVAIEDDDLRPSRRRLARWRRARSPRPGARRVGAHRLAHAPLGVLQRLEGARFLACNAAISPPAGSRSSSAATSPPSRRASFAPRGDRAEHRRAEQHRLAGLGRGDPPAGRVGDDLAHQRAARGAAAGHQRVETIAAALERADDLAEPLREAAKARDIEASAPLLVVAQDRGRRSRPVPRDRRTASDCRGSRAARAGRARASAASRKPPARATISRSSAAKPSAAGRNRRRPGSCASNGRSPRRKRYWPPSVSHCPGVSAE